LRQGQQQGDRDGQRGNDDEYGEDRPGEEAWGPPQERHVTQLLPPRPQPEHDGEEGDGRDAFLDGQGDERAHESASPGWSGVGCPHVGTPACRTCRWRACARPCQRRGRSLTTTTAEPRASMADWAI